MKRVIETLSSTISWNNLADGTEIASHETVQSYIDMLRSSYTATYIYGLNKKIKVNQPTEKPRKYTLPIPSYFILLDGGVTEDWISIYGSLEFLKNPENRSKLMESILCDHLIRFLFTQNLTPHFNYSDHVFYWKSKKKREVDFVVRSDDIFIPIELKYQSKIRRDDLYGIFDFMKGGRSAEELLGKN